MESFKSFEQPAEEPQKPEQGPKPELPKNMEAGKIEQPVQQPEIPKAPKTPELQEVKNGSREKLAEKIKAEPEKEKRRKILEMAKTTEEYRKAREEHLAEVKGKVEKGPKGAEKELSPEQIEKIMEKVEDIYQEGTAYTAITGTKTRNIAKTLESVLRTGLLGVPWEEKEESVRAAKEKTETALKEAWAKTVRSTKKGEVHFNIVGRALATAHSPDVVYFKEETPAGKAGKPYPRFRVIDYMWGFPKLIFDISTFQELEPMILKYERKKSAGREIFTTEAYNRDGQLCRVRREFKQLDWEGYVPHGSKPIKIEVKNYNGYEESRSGTYRIHAPKFMVDLTPDEKGRIGVSPEYGLQLNFRVAPRRFKGIVVQSKEEKEQVLEVMKKAYAGRPEKMLPIYEMLPTDANNDFYVQRAVEGHADYKSKYYNEYIQREGKFKLLWPKEMSDDEVRQFVEHRKAKEKKDKEGQ